MFSRVHAGYKVAQWLQRETRVKSKHLLLLFALALCSLHLTLTLTLHFALVLKMKRRNVETERRQLVACRVRFPMFSSFSSCKLFLRFVRLIQVCVHKGVQYGKLGLNRARKKQNLSVCFSGSKGSQNTQAACLTRCAALLSSIGTTRYTLCLHSEYCEHPQITSVLDYSGLEHRNTWTLFLVTQTLTLGARPFLSTV